MARISVGERSRPLDHNAIRAFISPEREAVLESQISHDEALLHLQATREARKSRKGLLASKLGELGLEGRPINFTGGVSYGTLRSTSHGIPFKAFKDRDITGVEGKVLRAVVDEHSTPELVVKVPGSLLPPKLPHTFLVRSDEATYSIGPQPEGVE